MWVKNIIYICVCVCVCDFAKRCPLSFRLNTPVNIARVQASVTGKKPGGLPSCWVSAESRCIYISEAIENHGSRFTENPLKSFLQRSNLRQKVQKGFLFSNIGIKQGKMGTETSKIAFNAHVHLRTANQQMSRPERHVDNITDMRRSCRLRENTSGRRP